MTTQSSPLLVVMAGGSGTRFWPKSTSRKPKQLLEFGGQTLLQRTFDRFHGTVHESRQWVVTTEMLKDAVREDSPHARVLAEPMARNTAACVYWAAQEAASLGDDPVMLVMPADHYIADQQAFIKVIHQAIAWAQKNDDLITLGVQPTRPETGYGYLKTQFVDSPSERGERPLRVERFVEKPNRENAERFVLERDRSGRSVYLWNAGMFVWRASVILRAFDRILPEFRSIWEDCKGMPERAYPQLLATSIDFGVMEKADRVVTFPLSCGWDDLGSWTSLEEMAEVLKVQGPAGVEMSGETVALDSQGNIVDVPEKVIALLGVRDLIIVEKGSVLMVAQKSKAQDIKSLVDKMKHLHPDLV